MTAVVSKDDGVPPLIEMTEGITALAVEDDYENIYDVPFIRVDRMDGEFIAEVVFSGIAEIDLDRLMTAQSVCRERGYRAYARFFSDQGADDGYNTVTLLCSNDPGKGTIWARDDDLWLN